MRVVSILATLILVAGLAACGGGGGPSDLNLGSTPTTVAAATTTSAGAEVGPAVSESTPSTPPTVLPAYASLVAQAHVPQLLVYAAPDAVRVAYKLANPWLADANEPSSQVAQIFLVEEERADGWVKVLLPLSPNGRSGWVHATDVNVTQVVFRIRIGLAAHKITVLQRGSVIYQGSVAVGAPASPTPVGRYYLRMLLKAPTPNTVYGPFAFGLSSRNGTFSTFEGADTELGIHGNNDPASLGRAITKGAIRIDNAEIRTLAALLPLGTPVDIAA